MFKAGMVVEALTDTRFCKAGEIAEVDVYTEEGEMELYFGDNEMGVPHVYFDFKDFKILVEDARIAQEHVKFIWKE